jgi:hypothetical protein
MLAAAAAAAGLANAVREVADLEHSSAYCVDDVQWSIRYRWHFKTIAITGCVVWVGVHKLDRHDQSPCALTSYTGACAHCKPQG